MQQIFQKKGDLENHKKTKHGQSHQKTTRYSCQKCHEMFPSVSDLKDHEAINHKVDFSCMMCRLDFISLLEMDNHMDERHEGRWKKYDPDVLREGDEESESDDDFTDSDDSKFEEKKN